MFVPIAFALCILIILLVYWKIVRPEKDKYDILRAQGIQGEPFVPLIGQLPLLRRYRQNDKIMRFHYDLAQKYGSTFVFCFGPSLRLVILEPDLLADIFSRNNASNYIKPLIVTSTLTPVIGYRNLLVTEGQEHERARHMINPAFYHHNLKSLVSIMTAKATKAIDELLADSTPDKPAPVDLQLKFNALTLSIIAASAFGSSFESNSAGKEQLCRTFRETFDAIIDRSLVMITQIPIISDLPIWNKDIVDRGTRIISDLVDRIIADRRQGLSSSVSHEPDLLDLLLSAVDEQGQPFTDQEIREQALTFVLAGSETTGNLMAWIFVVFMDHPDVLQACREEVDRVLAGGMKPTYEHLSELVVCEAVIHETLRLYPPAPLLSRLCIRDHRVGSKKTLLIPAGTTVVLNTYVLHRLADLWSRPEEFDYTRWLRDPNTGLKPKLPHPFAYLPFGAGPRTCIGQNFALLEAKILLSTFVQRCNFDFVPQQRIVPDFIVSMRTKYGLWAKLSPRRTH